MLSLAVVRSTKELRVTPGSTSATVTPKGLTSTRRASVRASTAYFVAW